MIDLDTASKEISGVITKHLPQLKLKYFSVEHNGAHLQCTLENKASIKLQAIPDYSRNQVPAIKSGLEYQKQGGHKAYAEKLSSYNKDAWKIEVKKTSSGSTFEIAFYGSESNWSEHEFEQNFIAIFL
jgi:hypothetical protein